MATMTIYANRATIKLNDGTSSGKVVTKSVSFPTLARNISMTEAQLGNAILAIATAYENIATREIYVIERTAVSRITAD